MGTSKGLMAVRINHCDECHDWRSAEEINDSVVTSCFILDVEVELLQICGPLLIGFILQLPLSLHELLCLMISVDDFLLPKNVIYPLATDFHNGVHLCRK